MRGTRVLMGVLVTVFAMALQATAGPEWIEGQDSGGEDAGPLPSNDQRTRGSGQLGAIRGKLNGLSADATASHGSQDFEDMYVIRIDDPSVFSASMVEGSGGFAEFDSKLSLFLEEVTDGGSEIGLGLLSNDNAPGQLAGSLIECPLDLDLNGITDTRDLKLFLPEWGPDETGNAADANDDGRVDILDLLILLATWGVCPGTGAEMGNMATDGTGAAVVKPGLYLLTISPSSRQPVSTGGPIFFFTDPTEISGPDGPGGQGPIVDWQDNDGDGDGEGIQGSGTLDGEYKVVLTGCSFAAPPLNNGVPVDLVPGKCPSDFEPTLQFLDAAFVSDNNFNAMDVDPKTVRLRRADGVGGDVSVNFFKRLDVTAPFAGEVCNCTQDPPDRLDDLYMGFSTSEMVAVMNLLDGIPPGEFVDRVMILSGLTFDGLSVEGRDCLRVFGDIKP